MVLHIYSDESGVFDAVHQDYFVFGGVIFLSESEKELAARRYASIENTIRAHRPSYADGREIKASNLGKSWRSSLVRSMNPWLKFGVVMELKKLNPWVFSSKRSKQRYMDYAYKVGLKYALTEILKDKGISASAIQSIYVNCDEHSTATNGVYEMEEGLLSEFKYGTFNYSYDRFFEPLFPKIKNVKVKFCSSSSTTLVRPADILANHIYHSAIEGYRASSQNLYLKYLP